MIRVHNSKQVNQIRKKIADQVCDTEFASNKKYQPNETAKQNFARRPYFLGKGKDNGRD